MYDQKPELPSCQDKYVPCVATIDDVKAAIEFLRVSAKKSSAVMSTEKFLVIVAMCELAHKLGQLSVTDATYHMRQATKELLPPGQESGGFIHFATIKGFQTILDLRDVNQPVVTMGYENLTLDSFKKKLAQNQIKGSPARQFRRVAEFAQNSELRAALNVVNTIAQRLVEPKVTVFGT